MEAKVESVRGVRLELALALASEHGGTAEAKQTRKQILKEFCRDPVIREVLKIHGVKIPK